MNIIQLIMAASCIVMLLLMLLVGLFLTSCSDIEENTSRHIGDQSVSAIGFSVEVPSTTRTASNTLTKDGTGTNEQSLKAKGFGVFASHTGNHPYVSSSTTSNLMWNQQVDWNSTAAKWAYDPVVYWPNADDDVSDYVTFFAYAPYSNVSSGTSSSCIVDFSLPGETGDPWLIYQLGGSTNADGSDGWKACQVDLLYDFLKDQQRPASPSDLITFNFRHALACVGDQITLTCGDDLQRRLKRLYAGTDGTADVTLTINRLSLDYELTSKAKLVLNGSIQPNWKPVESGETLVHRYLEFEPDHVIATVTSASNFTPADYTVYNQGLFYIPLEVGGSGQQLTVTVYYTVSTGSTGTLVSTVSLGDVASAGNGNNLKLTLSIPNL